MPRALYYTEEAEYVVSEDEDIGDNVHDNACTQPAIGSGCEWQ